MFCSSFVPVLFLCCPNVTVENKNTCTRFVPLTGRGYWCCVLAERKENKCSRFVPEMFFPMFHLCTRFVPCQINSLYMIRSCRIASLYTIRSHCSDLPVHDLFSSRKTKKKGRLFRIGLESCLSVRLVLLAFHPLLVTMSRHWRKQIFVTLVSVVDGCPYPQDCCQ